MLVLPVLTAAFMWRTSHDLAIKGAREETESKGPKDWPPMPPGPAAEPADGRRRGRAVRAAAGIAGAVGGAVGFVLGRRRTKKIVFEDRRR